MTDLIRSRDYQAYVRAYVDPDGAAEPIARMFERRNRLMSSGRDLCVRCDGLGYNPRDKGACILCNGTGTATGTEV